MRKSRISYFKKLGLKCAAASLIGVALVPVLSMAQSVPSVPVQAIAKEVRLAGQGQMRFLRMRIYDARLWVGPGFEAHAFEAHPLALELTYHRAFRGEAIAQRSVQEIQRQRTLSSEETQRWTDALAKWLPDVQAGDTLTGIYLPGKGMRLWLGSQDLGVQPDPELARYFFGIWLSEQTSEPGLRQALLASAGKDAR